MNNLKRILSLALASVMLVGMMVVGASATDYVDDEKIVNKDAVETLGALGIMNGDERGFRPEDGLTRAEAAKMLAKLHNKGVDVNFGAKTNPSFTDIKGHWAEDNIEYAYAFGIANGKGNGIFDPQGSLTVVQWARMILNMMGFTEGQTGSDWEIQTTVLASDNGLLDDLSIIPTANVTRDQAAQMLYNALNKPLANAQVITTYSYTLTQTHDPEDGSELETPVNLGVFDSTAEAGAYAAGNGLTLGQYSIRRNINTSTDSLSTKYLSLTQTPGIVAKVTDDGKGTYTVEMEDGSKYTKVAANYSNLMGQMVNVMYKTDSNVYGITAIGAVIYEGTVGEYTATYAAMTPGTAKSNIGAADIREFNNWNATHGKISAPSNIGDEQSLKLIQNGQTSYVAITVPQTVSVVTNVTAKTATIRGKAALEIGKGINLNGAVKGDTVLVTEAANTVSKMVELSKPEVIENVAADAYRTVGGSVDQVRVNGEWLTVLETTDFNELKPAANKTTTYNLVMVNGYVAAISKNESAAAASTDLLILTEVASGATNTSGVLNGNLYQEARAYFVKDGTTSVIRLKVAVDEDNNATPLEATAENKLYTYAVKDGLYEVTAVANDAATATKLGYDGAVENTTGVSHDNKLGSTLVSEGATIITIHKGVVTAANPNPAPVVEVVTGKDVRGWEIANGQTWGTSLAFTNKVNNIDYVAFAVLVDTSKALPGAAAIGNNYGYIVSTPYTTAAGVVYDLWTGAETLTAVTDDSGNSVARGDVIQYSTKGDKLISSTPLANDKFKAGAITGFNLTDKVITFANVANNQVLDEKTVILYVDSANVAGQATGELALATESTTSIGEFTPNVKYLMNDEDTDHVDLLVVDVTNNYDDEEAINVNWTADDVKTLTDGIYTYDGSTLSGIGDYLNNGGNQIFKFTSVPGEAEKTYTLSIKSSNGTEVYAEDAKFTDETAAGHFFVVNYKSMGDANKITANRGQAMAAGTYSVTITVTGQTRPVLTGSFTVPQ